MGEIFQILATKAEADPSGRILGRRHTMMEDSDISHTRMARAVVAAVLAAEVDYKIPWLTCRAVQSTKDRQEVAQY